MIELAVSQAQSQFTKLLSKSVLIIDKKSNVKKAVILPYEEYSRLVSQKNETKTDFSKGGFSKFVGILDKDFKTNDEKYNEIIK